MFIEYYRDEKNGNTTEFFIYEDNDSKPDSTTLFDILRLIEKLWTIFINLWKTINK